jgi:hypothetical protein
MESPLRLQATVTPTAFIPLGRAHTVSVDARLTADAVERPTRRKVPCFSRPAVQDVEEEVQIPVVRQSPRPSGRQLHGILRRPARARKPERPAARSGTLSLRHVEHGCSVPYEGHRSQPPGSTPAPTPHTVAGEDLSVTGPGLTHEHRSRIAPTARSSAASCVAAPCRERGGRPS